MGSEIVALQRQWAIAFVHIQAQVGRERARRSGQPFGDAAAYFDEMWALVRDHAAAVVDGDALVDSGEIDESFMGLPRGDRPDGGSESSITVAGGLER